MFITSNINAFTPFYRRRRRYPKPKHHMIPVIEFEVVYPNSTNECNAFDESKPIETLKEKQNKKKGKKHHGRYRKRFNRKNRNVKSLDRLSNSISDDPIEPVHCFYKKTETYNSKTGKKKIMIEKRLGNEKQRIITTTKDGETETITTYDNMSAERIQSFDSRWNQKNLLEIETKNKEDEEKTKKSEIETQQESETEQ
ncbi:hypothetical protein PCE1_002965 [Barthelona sp. PCE]